MILVILIPPGVRLSTRQRLALERRYSASLAAGADLAAVLPPGYAVAEVDAPEEVRVLAAEALEPALAELYGGKTPVVRIHQAPLLTDPDPDDPGVKAPDPAPDPEADLVLDLAGLSPEECQRLAKCAEMMRQARATGFLTEIRMILKEA